MAGNFLSSLFIGIKLNVKKITHNTFSEIGLNWFQVKYLKHLPRNKELRIKLFESYFYFKNGREIIAGLHELFIEKIYKQILPENAVIIDCGAHIGLSVLFLKRLCPSAIITAFEPDINNFLLLQKNIHSYNLTNVTLENKAVWNANATLLFKGDMDMAGHIIHSEIKNEDYIQVAAIRLKEIINKKIDFLKIDIEGAEYEVLKDIEDKLYLVDNLFLEYHGMFNEHKKLTAMFDILSKNNFSYYIKEAAKIHPTPFFRGALLPPFDVQLNIFCFKNKAA